MGFEQCLEVKWLQDVRTTTGHDAFDSAVACRLQSALGCFALSSTVSGWAIQQRYRLAVASRQSLSH